MRHETTTKSPFRYFEISLVARVWLLRASQSVGHWNRDLPGTARVQRARHNFGWFPFLRGKTDRGGPRCGMVGHLREIAEATAPSAKADLLNRHSGAAEGPAANVR